MNHPTESHKPDHKAKIAAMSQPLYPIGQQYKTRGKAPRLCTVIDIHRTYNTAGELVKMRYVSTHEFMGQRMTDNDVSEITIQMGEVK